MASLAQNAAAFAEDLSHVGEVFPQPCRDALLLISPLAAKPYHLRLKVVHVSAQQFQLRAVVFQVIDGKRIWRRKKYSVHRAVANLQASGISLEDSTSTHFQA